MSDESPITFTPERALAVRPTDLLDRRRLSQIGVPTFVHLWARWGIPLTTVPGDYWVQDVDEETKASIAVVSCPCGNDPRVPAGGFVMCREDESEWETCPRAFVFTGRSVIAAGTPPQRA